MSELIPHPVCGHMKPQFAHRASGPCDWCEKDIEREYLQPPVYVKTMDDIRGERNVQLEATDWVETNPGRVRRSKPEYVAAIHAYRELLLDITEVGDPALVVWPVHP